MVIIFGTKNLKSIIVYILLLLFTRGLCQEGNSRFKREPIVDGAKEKISKVPYFASLVEYDSGFQQWYPVCGASIISNKWILTAAHCIMGPIRGLKIRTGFDDYFSPKDGDYLHDIFNVIPRTGFCFQDLVNYNDIGLINLTKPIDCNQNSQMPIALPSEEFDVKTGLKLNILGFGLQTTDVSDGKTAFPINLLSGTVEVMKKEDCETFYSGYTIDNHICATSKKNEVALGDSGGPAVAKSQLIGIISTGGMKLDKYPGLYIDVHKHVDWIRNTVGAENFEMIRMNNNSCTIS